MATAARNLATTGGPQSEQEEMIQMLHAQIKAAKRAVENSKHTNDAAYSGWASALLQLAVFQDDLTIKNQHLEECIEKFDRALGINPDSKCPDGQLSLFQLGNAYFVKYMFEKDDQAAEKLLDQCKTTYKKGIKKDPSKIEIIKTIAKVQLSFQLWCSVCSRGIILLQAPQQRKEVQEAQQRMEGKTPEEQAEEYIKIVYEQTVALEKDVNENPQDGKKLKLFGSTLLELSMIQENKQEIEKARATVRRAKDYLKKSSELEKDQETFTVLAVALNAVGMIEEDPDIAYGHFVSARKAFQDAIQLEQDVESVKKMLVSLRDMYKTQDNWKEMHPLQAHKMKVDPIPPQLANLGPGGTMVEEANTTSSVKEKKGRQGGKAKGDKSSGKEESKTETPALLDDDAAGDEEGAENGTNNASEKKKRKRRKKKAGSSETKGPDGLGDSSSSLLKAAGAATVVAIIGLVAVMYLRRNRAS